jgi:hypothetical protein
LKPFVPISGGATRASLPTMAAPVFDKHSIIW